MIKSIDPNIPKDSMQYLFDIIDDSKDKLVSLKEFELALSVIDLENDDPSNA